MIPEPPKRALGFLRWFCREDSIEEIEGDLIELFEMSCMDNLSKARRQFIWRVILSFRPEFIRSLPILRNSNIKSMIQHNILMSYRSFKRYKSSFLINLFGLSTGLACVLLIWLWVSDEMSVDKYHVKDDRIYEVMEHVTQAQGMITRYTTSGPMSKSLAEEFPEVEKAVSTTTLWDERFVLSVKDNDITATGIYADADFFNIFSFDLLQGRSDDVLQEKQSVVLSEQLAMNLFGTTENVVGKIVQLEHETEFLVSGIMEEVPGNSSFNFDFVMSFELYRDQNNWSTTGTILHLLLTFYLRKARM